MKKFYPAYLKRFGVSSVLPFLRRNTFKISKIVRGSGFLILSLGVFSMQAQLPTDFQRVELVENLSNATVIKFAPDGRLFIVDRYGEIIIYKTDTQTTVSAGSLSVFHELEDGLLGLAFDPNFEANNYIYLHYSPLAVSKNRVSRFTMNGDAINIGSEIIMLEWDTQRNNYYHAAGDMDFDSQGNLYIATGDNSNHSPYARLDETDPDQSAENTSSNTNDLRGKILRITPQPDGTYTIPAGNLFDEALDTDDETRPEIYVMGARNPYRIFVDKTNTDWLFWGEVGPDANSASSQGPEGLDEINLTKAAGNYGWPYFTGANEAHLITYLNPQIQYDPATPLNQSVWNTGLVNLPPAQPSWLDFFKECYLTGPRYYYDGTLTDDTRMPVEFDQALFYYDFNTSRIWVAQMDGDGNLTNNEQLAPLVFPNDELSGDPRGFIDLEMGPDGHLYILEYGGGCCPQNTGTGKLVRVDYTGIITNRSPVVEISADPNNGALPLTVNFSSEGTFDPDGDTPLTYSWDFETDGTIDSTEENPTHTYTVEGTFNAQLRVSDGNGGEGVKNVTIYAGNTATAFSFNSPPDGGFIDWGDDISLDVSATDVEDGAIDCADINVVPSVGHENHFHDGLTVDGCPKTVTLDADGHDLYGEMDIFFVLGANFTDSGGLSSFDQIRLHPKRKEAEHADQQSNITIISNTDPWGGGTEAIQVDHDSYVTLEGRNLLNMTSVKYRVAAAAAGGSIELRLGSPTGTLLATTNIPATGGPSSWADVESAFTDPGGKNDLYFVFKATPGAQDIFNLNYIEFIGNGVSTDNSPPEVNEVTSISSTEVSVEYSEAVSQATAENLSNYSLDNGVTITAAALQPDNRTVILTTSPLSSGINYQLTISNVENAAGLQIVTGSYTFFIFDPIRINAGGAQETIGGEVFVIDQNFSGGSEFSSTVAIEGTTDDAAYQTERWGEFTYNIPISVPGPYDIRLHFAEIFYGVPGAGSGGGAGSRIFNVSIEGNQVLSNFDILQETQPATVLLKEFDDVEITDGFATISFEAVVQNPKISAIEILPPNTFSVTPGITILAPKNGVDVNQPFDVNFALENWEIAEGSTHMHYYVDGQMVGPHYSYGPITIDGLTLGSHTIRLELFDVGHVPTGIFDEVTVNVTDQLSCNDGQWPDQWVVHEIDDALGTAPDARVVYILPHYDLDGDGLKDIATGAFWYKNPGTAGGNWQQQTVGAPFNDVAYIYDFDGDGDMDLFGTRGTTYVSSDLAWAENDGSGNFTVHTNIPSGTTTFGEKFIAGIAGGVYNSGGDFQLAISWNGGETGSSQLQMITVPADPVNTNWSIADFHPTSLGEGISNGDIDGDGDLDIFQGENWLRNEGDGSWTEFSTGLNYPSTADRKILADIDRDGDLDGVVSQISSNQEIAWFETPADPTQNWTKNTIDPDIDGGLSVYVIDFDFDGDQDVIVGEWQGNNQLLGFENDLCDSGTWIKHTIDAGGTGFDHHDGAQVVDIDNDGDLDIVSIGWNNITPRIFENTTESSLDDPIADAGPDQQITLPTDSITLNGSGSDPDGGDIVAYEWSQQSGPSVATLSGASTPDLTASDLVEGTYTFRLTVTDDENDTGFDEVLVEVVSSASLPYHINSGGPAYTNNGIDWIVDQFFTNGFEFTKVIDISNTDNQELYHTERYSNSGTLTYEIPVTNGTYDLNLHFAEIFFGLPGLGQDGGVGSRVFNVSIEDGQQTLDNYDIFAAAGGPAIAVVENLTDISVTDGSLSIVLTAIVENPKISGIEVFLSGAANEIPVVYAGETQTISLPDSDVILDGSAYDPDGGPITQYQWTQISGPNTATLTNANTDDLLAEGLVEGTYIFRLTATDDEGNTGFDEVSVIVADIPMALRINSGGPAFNFNTEEWSEDQSFVDGEPFESVIPIANTENDQLYQTERFSEATTLTYDIPVENGSHNIRLHFAEIFFGVPGGPGESGGAGSRVFNIDIENGQQTIDNYDIFVASGGPATAVVEVFNNVEVTDGRLTIVLTSVVQNPKISGIEVIESRTPIVDAGPDQTIALPTNSVELNGTAFDPDGGEITYAWTQESGPATASLQGSDTADLTASDLVEGVYVFRLTVTDDENETAFDEVTVTVSGENQPPVAVATATPTTGDAPLEVSFSSNGSSDDVGIATYFWDFMDGNTSTEANPVHTFTTDGTYNVVLTVTDDGGLSDTATVTIVVGDADNMPPTAVIEANPLTGAPPLEVTFTGANSTDDTGITSYQWEFGDGTTSDEIDPVHTYDTLGEYIVSLTVVDDGGLTNTATVTIVVTESSGKMSLILLENPTRNGMAQLSIRNPVPGVEVFGVRLYDIGGKLISSHMGQDLDFENGAYQIPVNTVRTGLYLLRVILNEGESQLVKVLIQN